MQQRRRRDAEQQRSLSRIGPAFVCLAYALIAGVAGVHFRVLLPRAAGGDGSSAPLRAAFRQCVSVFLLLELLAQYSLAVWTDPGYVERTALRDADDSSNGSYAAVDGICSKCAAGKPRRAHHCRVCAACVHEMDHHCPWINNCVGANNYRFFWLLLLYLWVCCAYVATLSYEPFAKVLQAQKHRKATRTTLPLEDRVGNVATLFSFLLTSTLGVALCGYWTWHLYLALTQQTMIEFAGRASDPSR